MFVYEYCIRLKINKVILYSFIINKRKWCLLNLRNVWLNLVFVYRK